MFVDSHAHLFEEKIDLSKTELSNLDWVLVPTYRMQHIELVRKFCLEQKKCLFSVGVYPEFAYTFDKKQFLSFVKKYRNEIVAIGEIGLDLKYSNYDLQKQVLREQMKIAKDYVLPISVHLRGDVYRDFWAIFDEFKVPCALHCFSGTKTDLFDALERNCYISFAANITYKRNDSLRSLAKNVPDSNLLIETDSPSMPPSVFPRGTVNTSENITYVADCLANVRGTDIAHIAKVTSDNANRLFRNKK